ncbi:MAG TPA: type II toxin-antitoxin system Phd/YefM family antitoxin [Synergistaceae bacterium]|nr:type II toxin-antitoxin system Phd/YefM family antitoxin [Synergistaceae bacterium]HPJ26340.1 type II toxin-antitoxin system Phd/YefM family antitoxin [Synergistaceae bacterium]HPQ38116.1 type II toxin-antitoxin system Phd/YefM family antitoxin [Synergistaceae bacterium]
MLSTNITQFRKDIFSYVDKAIRFNQVINVTTKEGSAVVMGLDDYNALMETVYLFSHSGTAREIEEGLATPWEECLPESEVSL